MLAAPRRPALGEPLEHLGCPGGDCKPVPCSTCPDCSCPCERRLPLNLFGDCHVEALIEKLHTGDCCERIEAARKLGNRFHADFCSQPCVLSGSGAALRDLLGGPSRGRLEYRTGRAPHRRACWPCTSSQRWTRTTWSRRGPRSARHHDALPPGLLQVRLRARRRPGQAKEKYAPGSCDCGAIFGGCGAPRS